jgi:hypothetical protein
MRRTVAFLPSIAFAAAAAVLLYIGASLYSQRGTDLSWTRRDAFAHSVQAGERIVAARNLAGALRLELATERARSQRDERFAFLTFGAALLVVMGALVHVAIDGARRTGSREPAAA